jgi:bacteriocin biosynthesis cyclodehydratase domain-containing protein
MGAARALPGPSPPLRRTTSNGISGARRTRDQSMAAALRLAPGMKPYAMNRNTEVHIYAIGSFGASVAHVLRLYIPSLVVTYSAEMGLILGEPPSGAGTHVLAVAAPAVADIAAFSRLCYTSSSIVIPLVLQSESLWFGPVMGPPRGPCWNCAMRRYNQHKRHGDAERPPTNTSRQEFPSLLPFVSSAIWHLVHVSQLGLSPVGFVWRMDLNNREIIGRKVVGVHRCDLCGLGRRGTDISTKQMRESLSYLYSNLAISLQGHP